MIRLNFDLVDAYRKKDNNVTMKRTYLIRRRVSIGIFLMATALLCEIFLARPILHQATGKTEVELINDVLAKSQVLSALENRWGHMSMPRPGGRMSNPNSRPGFRLAQKGAKATYPIIMVPGKLG